MRPLAAVPLALVLGIAASSAYAGYSAVDLYTIRPPAGLSTADPASQTQGVAGVQVGGSGTTSGSGSPTHAVVWNASGVPTDLHPTGAVNSRLLAINGVQQAGYADLGTGGSLRHAFLWTGTSASGVDLNPAGIGPTPPQSQAWGTSGSQQVGQAYENDIGFEHAFLWRGSSVSAVDLNPAWATASLANGTDGVHQVGYAVSGQNHAVLWSGTAASAVDLNPARLSYFTSTEALAVSGNEQVGLGIIPTVPTHALLWHGTGDSAVDLQPGGVTYSQAWGTNGTQQVGEVGFAVSPNSPHAVVWSGSAESMVDLQQFLPAGWTSSQAFTIDANGNVFGIASDASNQPHAVEWENVPEPTSLSLIGLGALLGRRSRWPALQVG